MEIQEEKGKWKQYCRVDYNWSWKSGGIVVRDSGAGREGVLMGTGKTLTQM